MRGGEQESNRETDKVERKRRVTVNRGKEKQIVKGKKIMRHDRHECLFIQTICRDPHTARQASSPCFISPLFSLTWSTAKKKKKQVWCCFFFKKNLKQLFQPEMWKKNWVQQSSAARLLPTPRRPASNYLHNSCTRNLTGLIDADTLQDS